jgi:hypothetical protein
MVSRRKFCAVAGASTLSAAVCAVPGGTQVARLLEQSSNGSSQRSGKRAKVDVAPVVDVAAIDHARILRAAERYLGESPVTITAFPAPRSAGKLHDYFSEADYWWPDPANPGGPYIDRDGMSNPDNFVDHRRALIRLSIQASALGAAWFLTKQERYAEHAARHLSAWFVDEATRMNPNLEYAQAIHGRVTGRGIGIIDTLQLVEVARAATLIENSRAFGKARREGVKDWFREYLQWMTTSEKGAAERDTKNNHSTCWVLQVAEFARYTNNAELGNFCRTRFKTVLVPNQIAANGSFPLKPYGYSLFNLDAMATACQALSTPEDNLWTYELTDGRGLRKAMEYMFPFIADKKKWPLRPDVQYFENWPVRQPSLLFAGLAFRKPEYVELWKRLDPDPTVQEVVRNFPIRQPVMWVR